ncbi:hypothetical protein [Aliarcobacter butzleri]|uniref:hypothetical protein n=1 Tax=Aliarcobacter butzleri TaxID=28197 RepID=UPI0021B345ED|nr:hypothetical protein [Aliarcobacter butzleri]MCT7568702.1 hypothetical protein [Aliarcobacter butzleri]
MELIKFEKYLDSPTTSCDGTSNVHDCYILIPTQIHHYFQNIQPGDVVLKDITTNQEYTLNFTQGREFRLNQFRQYVNDKNITMGDKIIIYILMDNNTCINLFIDVVHENFFINTRNNIYKGYLKNSFQELFTNTNSITINLNNDRQITINKINEEYEINDDLPSKFILEEAEDNYILIQPSRPNSNLEEIIEISDDLTDNIQEESAVNQNVFISFLKKIEKLHTLDKPNNISYNIKFDIGQPNTGKSYNFEESRLFDLTQKNHYKYIKIPVSGGIGNEYKGLQNTDLAITYDPIKKEVRFGEFLQVLMSAIVNPKVPHVVFLDDFHNQDISSLLSEYTPLFKSQQKAEIKSLTSDDIFKEDYENSDEFIKTWNSFIENHCSKDINDNEVSIVPITNRISGNSLKLIYPNNFYLLGAANFNENTLNIFADWEDRAVITYKDPINTFSPPSNETEFVDCCIELNKKLHQILKDKLIFDTEKYCFGMWKIVDSNGNAISDLDEQKKVVKFLFGMIKNALRFNNKNSWINKIGWELFVAMQTNEWFKNNIKMINGNIENIDYEILHEFNIYEDEI